MWCPAVDPEPASGDGRTKPPWPRRTPREVADELRARIGSGALRPGRRMPTRARPAAESGVERQALRILQSERLLTNVSTGAPAA
ncbi:GntR family transcriptional regulator, partial [Streptomyces sp. NPDC126497]|uniref:GntR family transcriptional regulator n=1 Tax=Streptomyces sp. NPDC126497 TaxID=3155313 RepID=UPI003321C1D2